MAGPSLGLSLEEVRQCKSIFNSLFGRKASKFWRRLLLDIMLVDEGLKPGFLFDYACPSIDKLCTFIQELYEKGSIRNKLMVVSIEVDVFVGNIEVLLSNLRKIVATSVSNGQTDEPGPMVLVDASDDIENPKKVDKCHETVIIKQIENILSQLSEDRSRPMIALKCDGFCNTTLFGILLNYPVVYWTSSREGNCLGMVPLNVYTLTIPVNKLMGPEFAFDYDIYSFTAPKALEKVCESVVEKWRITVMDLPYNNLSFRDSFQFKVKTITLAELCL